MYPEIKLYDNVAEGGVKSVAELEEINIKEWRESNDSIFKAVVLKNLEDGSKAKFIYLTSGDVDEIKWGLECDFRDEDLQYIDII